VGAVAVNDHDGSLRGRDDGDRIRDRLNQDRLDGLATVAKDGAESIEAGMPIGVSTNGPEHPVASPEIDTCDPLHANRKPEQLAAAGVVEPNRVVTIGRPQHEHEIASRASRDGNRPFPIGNLGAGSIRKGAQTYARYGCPHDRRQRARKPGYDEPASSVVDRKGDIIACARGRTEINLLEWLGGVRDSRRERSERAQGPRVARSTHDRHHIPREASNRERLGIPFPRRTDDIPP
jgi:hypothetical protein